MKELQGALARETSNNNNNKACCQRFSAATTAGRAPRPSPPTSLCDLLVVLIKKGQDLLLRLGEVEMERKQQQTLFLLLL